VRQLPVGVIQICWMQPGPAISPSVKALWALMRTEGDTFQPRPRSPAARAPVPLVAMPAAPFAPVKFSGEIERVCASDVR